MSFDFQNLARQSLSQQQLVLSQEPELPQYDSGRDPLIDYGAEHLIDFGVVLLVFTIIIIVGILSKHAQAALLFALGLSTFLIIILWYI